MLDKNSERAHVVIVLIGGSYKELPPTTDRDISVHRISQSESFDTAIRDAVSRRAHLLLARDCIVSNDAIAELANLAEADPKFGLVLPRSDRGGEFQPLTSGDLPFSLSPAELHSATNLLTNWQFVPAATGACVLVANHIVQEFEGFFSAGFSFEKITPISLQLGLYGYRCVLSNRAIVQTDEAYFAGTPSLSPDLFEKFPALRRSLREYWRGPDVQLERFAGFYATRANRPAEVLLDISAIGTTNNGTAEATKRVIQSLLDNSPRFNLTLLCGSAEVEFHGLRALFPSLPIESPTTTRIFDFALRLCLPFNFDGMFRMSRLAWCTCYMALDTIPLDCYQVRPEQVDPVWKIIAETSEVLMYNSEVTRDLFTRRFRVGRNTLQQTIPHSLAARDYGDPAETAGRGEYILLAGNPLPHKYLDSTLKALHANFPDLTFKVMGQDSNPDLRFMPFGSGYEDAMKSLYENARCVIFPSLNEGFGLPIAEGMARGKRVFARSSALCVDYVHGWTGPGAVTLFETTQDLVTKLKEMLSRSNAEENALVASHDGNQATQCWNWKSSGKEMIELIARAMTTVQFADVQNRVELMHLVESARITAPQAPTFVARMKTKGKRLPLVGPLVSKLRKRS